MERLSYIRERLAAREPTPHPPGTAREAAVAVILRPSDAATDILFIRRAVKTGDPWSGHMAFPGGHREDHDRSLRAAAERETLEEIGIDLSAADYLGALDPQHAAPKARPAGLLVVPHVYALEDDPALALNFEVAEVVWSPLGALLDNQLHATETRPMSGRPTIFNGYRLAGGHFVWGLTYRMLKSFFTVLDPDWQSVDVL